MNLLKSKDLRIPSITLMALFINELSPKNIELYEAAKTNEVMEHFLYLYEFLIFNQVQQLILLKNFDRALFELMKITRPLNEFNNLLFKVFLGLCLSQCYYYDAAIYNLCEGANVVQKILDRYKSIDNDLGKDNIPKIKKETEESKH